MRRRLVPMLLVAFLTAGSASALGGASATPQEPPPLSMSDLTAASGRAAAQALGPVVPAATGAAHTAPVVPEPSAALLLLAGALVLRSTLRARSS